jgi:DNA-binding NarL/FixJ family response regulator
MERSLDGPDIAVAVLDRCWLTGTALGMLIDDAAGFRLAGAFREADEVMRASRRTAVGVVVANLDGVSGPFADDVARLHRRSTIPVAVVVPVLDAAAIGYAVETQVEALLPRDERPSAIFAALRQVAAGHVLLPRGWQQALAAERAAHAVLDGLSRRQREIFELLAEGRPNHEIAHRLSISVNTVKFHVRCIYEQLGIRSRLEAARMHATL